VTDSERDAAWKRIRTAAKKFNVDVEEEDWRDLKHHGKRSGRASHQVDKLTGARHLLP